MCGFIQLEKYKGTLEFRDMEEEKMVMSLLGFQRTKIQKSKTGWSPGIKRFGESIKMMKSERTVNKKRMKLPLNYR